MCEGTCEPKVEEKFYKLTDLSSPEIAEFATAFSKFQNEVKSVGKKGKAGDGKFSYHYAKLEDFMDYVLPLLSKQGLSVTQQYADNHLVTTVYHSSGQFIRSFFVMTENAEFRGQNAEQAKGSVSTYNRRYALQAILGLTAKGEDNDAQSVTEKQNQPTETKEPKKDRFNFKK